jgi:transketolase
MPQAVVSSSEALDQLCVNTIRLLSVDMVQKANSGHPGAPMGQAPIGYVLWAKHLRHNPANPSWPGRDRFVLSGGHASALLYSLLHLFGYDLSLDELRAFRQWGSRTPGHPERGHPIGAETTTGPLGQGAANAVGMAIAQAHLAAAFGREGHSLFEHRTYFFAGDGDLMEGVSHEAASLAGNLKLGNLIGFYDDNAITIDGPASLAVTDDAQQRFESYGWQVQTVEDGNDLHAIDAAIESAKRTDNPSLIIVRTQIGYGSPNKQGKAAAHGAPLGEDEVKLTKENLGWPYAEPFTVPDDTSAVWGSVKDRGIQAEATWLREFEAYAKAYPEQAAEFSRRLNGELPEDWREALPDFSSEAPMATRGASGKTLNAIAGVLPELVGGSADLAASNLTMIKDSERMSADRRDGRNVYFGVREHAMGSVMNGMALHGGVLPYGGTFLVFSDYMRPAIRLAAMMGLHVVYVFTHDSIGLGEDGPTHQPIEILPVLRAIPNLTVIRPADAVETAEAWRVAMERNGGPVALVLTRQKLTPLDRSKLDPEIIGVAKGAYVLAEADGVKPAVLLIATGSEVAIALEAQGKLKEMGVAVRVVNMPCAEVFAEQDASYRDEVLPPGIRARVAIEAAHPMSWYEWVGLDGAVVGMESFGASAPYERLYQEFGITADAVVARVKTLLNR